MPPSIEEIPTAAQLQQRLDILNNAIAALGAGAPVTNLTVAPAPDTSGTAIFAMPMMVLLDPPITNATTLASLMGQLGNQADIVEQQLMDMGYAPPSRRAADVTKAAEASLSQTQSPNGEAQEHSR